MSDPSPRRTRRAGLLHLWLAAVMALLAAAAVLVFFAAEAKACAMMPNYTDCIIDDVDKEQMPECFDVQHDPYGGYAGYGCEYSAQITNHCDHTAKLSFFCDEDLEEDCSGDRALAPGEQNDIPMLALSHSFVEEQQDKTWEGTIGVHVEFLDGSSSDEDNGESDGENDEDQLEPAATFDVSAKYVEEEQEDTGCAMPRSDGPMGCSGGGSSSTAPVSIALVMIALLALTRLRRTDDEPLTDNH